MKLRSKLLITLAVLLLLGAAASSRLIETNQSGHFQVKQQWITGEMTVITNEGTYWQGNGTITDYKRVATIGFGGEVGEGSADIDAIPVIFNDGSTADISGLVRLRLPAQDGVALKQEFSMGYDHFIEAGVLPVIRNAVKLSANLRSAQDAYTTLAVFQQAVKDQVEKGTYVTRSVRKEITNATGTKEVRQITEIVRDSLDNPIREPNRLMELGCEVRECVIDVPKFDAAVMLSINKRKEEAMKTELSKQTALRAKQDAITSAQQGLANVAKAKYEEEVTLTRATTKARQVFEVAEFEKKTAKENKAAAILRAEGVKQELLLADGLSARAKYQIDANVKQAIGVAEKTFGGNGIQFPSVMVNGTGKNGQVVDPFTAVGLESYKNMANPKTKKN